MGMNGRVIPIGKHSKDPPGTNWPALMAFPVIPGVGLSQDAIAYIAGVSRSRINQIEDHAIAKLARFFATAQGRKILAGLR